MPDITPTGFALYAVSSLFALASAVNLSGTRAVHAAYRFWHYPRRFYRTVGLLELGTAVLLVMPPLRIWGLLLAAAIAFFSVVTLLYNRQHLWSLPAMFFLMALIPASLA